MIENLDLKLSGQEPVTRKELINLISSWGRISNIQTNDRIKIEECNPKECYDLSNLDVSQIDDLSDAFRYSFFNGDLSKWNLSNCTNMNSMFFNSKFDNNSLKDWNTSKVESMSFMFYGSKFNGNLSRFDVSNCNNLKNMFDFSQFDGDISSWKINKESNCYEIFYNNNNFKQKYNNNKSLPDETKEFLNWFEKNREKMKEINTPKQEILDFFDFNNKEIEL